jgi:hypothetical protein
VFSDRTRKHPERESAGDRIHREGVACGIHSVGTPLLVNQWLTLPQCIKLSASQMQPRSAAAVESMVKQTRFICLQGIPRSEIDPSGAVAGTVAVE